MENKPQTPQTVKQTPDVRDPGDPKRQMFAAPPSAREDRMSEPAVETDGQMVEAGYGHGV